MLNDGERQVAPELSGIRRDHVARYQFAARLLGLGRRAVVDLACGVGYGSAVLADFGHSVVGIDRNAEAIAYANEHYSRPGVTFACGDLDELAAGRSSELLAAVTYDAAVCFETIEHLRDPLPLLRALRASAPLLIASVPNEAVFPHGGRIKFHFRHYTRAEFEALLNAAGFVVTGWYGQAGPLSEVEAELEGRTLVVTARRGAIAPAGMIGDELHEPRPDWSKAPVICDDVEWKAAGGNLASSAPVPDHVAIVGLGPSCSTFFELTRRLGGVSAYCDEVWGINAIGNVLDCDRVFHMDDLRVQEVRAAARPESNIAAMVQWLRRHPGPVYTSIVREGYPGLVAFPLEAVLNGGHDDSNGGAPYFNSTAAYAVAFAIHIGVKRISLFGLDYTLANSHKAEKGRACVEFWLGIAAARGIEITLPDTSSLMDACEPPENRLYGYDCVDVFLRDQPDGGVKVEFVDRATMPTAAEIEARYDHSKHPNGLISSAAKKETER